MVRVRGDPKKDCDKTSWYDERKPVLILAMAKSHPLQKVSEIGPFVKIVKTNSTTTQPNIA